MLTRPGSNPGPEWMKKLDASSRDPREHLRSVKRLWLFYGLPTFAALFLGLALVPQAARHGNYESPMRTGGMPLLSTGSTPHGVIAIGGRATGILAIGGIATGWIAVGAIAVGGVALGGLSVGLFAFGALAIGWRAMGGAALGHAALGGLAVGGYAYAGSGAAYGYHQASGKLKENLFG
jgi:hypothetical protein